MLDKVNQIYTTGEGTIAEKLALYNIPAQHARETLTPLAERDFLLAIQNEVSMQMTCGNGDTTSYYKFLGLKCDHDKDHVTGLCIVDKPEFGKARLMFHGKVTKGMTPRC